MEWVKDPKNQPIVAAIAIALIIGVAIFYYFNFIKAPATGQTATTADTTAPVAPEPGAAPVPAPAGTPAATAPVAPTAAATTATTAAAPAAGKGVQMASVTPMETWRGDPFQPIGYKAPRTTHMTAPIRDLPIMTLPGVYVKSGVVKEEPEIQQPPRRMAGILLNHRVYAIIEENGGSEVVQPGDYLKDHLATVQRIMPDRIVLKTVDKKPRYITVKMAASAHQATPTSPVGGSAPVMPRVTGPRGMPMMPGLGPPPPPP